MKQPFELIQFADVLGENIVFLESPRGDFISDDPKEAETYLAAFRRVTEESLSAAESVSILRKAASEMT